VDLVADGHHLGFVGANGLQGWGRQGSVHGVCAVSGGGSDGAIYSSRSNAHPP
jgi:hypothetical protein